jgi:hypothetical protein
MKQVQFVSAFWCLNDTTAYVMEFEKMAASGVSILLFLDPRLEEIGGRLMDTYPNVKVVGYEELPPQPSEVQLPSHRNAVKDSADYFWIMSQKLDTVRKALPFTDRPFLAWVDFRLFHVFHGHEEACQARLRDIEEATWDSSKIVAPGCWTCAGVIDPFESVSWRFCGGVFITPRGCIEAAARKQEELLRAHLPRLTWEVNYWTLMEDHFQWCLGDHDPTILNLNIDKGHH